MIKCSNNDLVKKTLDWSPKTCLYPYCLPLLVLKQEDSVFNLPQPLLGITVRLLRFWAQMPSEHHQAQEMAEGMNRENAEDVSQDIFLGQFESHPLNLLILLSWTYLKDG